MQFFVKTIRPFVWDLVWTIENCHLTLGWMNKPKDETLLYNCESIWLPQKACIGLYLKRKRCLSCPPINVPVFFSNCPITVNLVTKCPVMKGKLWNTSTHIIVFVACIKNDLVLSLQTYCGVLKFEGVCEVCVAYTSWATFLSKLCITYCITKNWTPEVCATRGQFIIFYS